MCSLCWRGERLKGFTYVLLFHYVVCKVYLHCKSMDWFLCGRDHRHELLMLRSRLKNNFNRKRSDKKWNKYKKQINFCINFLRQINIKSKSEEHIIVINGKSISDNKKFWKTRLDFFSNKGLITNNMLLENNEIVR